MFPSMGSPPPVEWSIISDRTELAKRRRDRGDHSAHLFLGSPHRHFLVHRRALACSCSGLVLSNCRNSLDRTAETPSAMDADGSLAQPPNPVGLNRPYWSTISLELRDKDDRPFRRAYVARAPQGIAPCRRYRARLCTRGCGLGLVDAVAACRFTDGRSTARSSTHARAPDSAAAGACVQSADPVGSRA
jgi:hypothetical protein